MYQFVLVITKNCCFLLYAFPKSCVVAFTIHNLFAMKSEGRNFKANLFPCGLSLAFLLIASMLVAQTSMLPNAFSHNDYRRKRPLSDALDNGFRYVEADVYLRKGKLVVAHILPCLKRNRTLEDLYLKPLLDYVQQHKEPSDQSPVTLMIDIKSDSKKTYRALLAVLEKYQPILSGYENGHTVIRNVTIVISGHKPSALVHMARSGFVFLDDDLRKITPVTSTDLYPIASCKYSRLMKWKGKGPVPTEELTRLAMHVEAAHKTGRKVRLWASPENKVVWNELLKCKVDLINTNRLSSLRKFLTAATARVFKTAESEDPAQQHAVLAVAPNTRITPIMQGNTAPTLLEADVEK